MRRWAALFVAVTIAASEQVHGAVECARGFERPTTLLTLPGRTIYRDIDHDGAVEAIVFDGFLLRVLKRRGPAVFETISTRDLRVTNPPIAMTGLLAVADMDGDGNDDAIFKATQFLAVVTGNGDGTFAGEVVTYTAPQPITFDDWRLADATGDGVADFVAMANANFVVVTFRDRRLVLAANVLLVPQGQRAYADAAMEWTAGDFDGDGRTDVLIAFADIQTQRWYWYPYWNDGDLRFTSTSPLDFGPARHLSPADFEGDGRTEVVATNPDELFVLRLARDGSSAERTPVGLLTGNLRVTAVADIDRDGARDLVLTSAFGAGVLWGSPAGFSSVSYVSVPEFPHEAVLADADGDGGLDLAGGPAAAYGREGRAFTAPRRYPLALRARDLFRVDVDEDGVADDVVNDLSEIEVLLARGTAFVRGPKGRIDYDTTDDRVRAFADFDGDGHADYAGNFRSNGALTVAVRFGDGPALDRWTSVTVGNGRLLGSIALTTDERPVLLVHDGERLQSVRITSARGAESSTLLSVATNARVFPFDADGDGDTDLVVSAGNANQFFENVAGSFAAGAPIEASFTYDGVTGIDVDGDAAHELSLWSPSGYSVFRRAADGHYRPTSHGSTRSSVRGQYTADWDGDGDPDLITISYSSSADRSWVQLDRNDGGQLQPRAMVAIARSDGDAYVADADGDGLPDLYVLTAFGIEIVRNDCATPRVALAASPANPAAGERVTLIASVTSTTGTFSGVLRFEDASGVICEPDLEPSDNATARCETPPLPPGPHRFTASYRDQYAGPQEGTLEIRVPPPRHRAARH